MDLPAWASLDTGPLPCPTLDGCLSGYLDCSILARVSVTLCYVMAISFKLFSFHIVGLLFWIPFLCWRGVNG